MRLIDADALTAKLKEVGQYLRNPAYRLACIAAINELKNAPTIDAVPVRHGKWINREYGLKRDGRHYPFWERYECSVCGAKADESEYCPRCGAKMDGENETD